MQEGMMKIDFFNKEDAETLNLPGLGFYAIGDKGPIPKSRGSFKEEVEAWTERMAAQAGPVPDKA
jgi:hypothetical protein